MSEPRTYHFHVGDKINFSQKALEYSDGLDQIGFVASAINYDATLRNLELTSEAAVPIFPNRCRRSIRRLHGVR